MKSTPPDSKHNRMEARIMASYAPEGDDLRTACLRGYIQCFNAGQYYEAHDVLEHYWLKLPRGAPEYSLHKGLIQLAGAFVHLRLHYLYPEHPVHGKRLSPARKLFALAEANLRPHEQSLTVTHVPASLVLMQRYTPRAPPSYTNPWRPEYLPQFPEGAGS